MTLLLQQWNPNANICAMCLNKLAKNYQGRVQSTQQKKSFKTFLIISPLIKISCYISTIITYFLIKINNY